MFIRTLVSSVFTLVSSFTCFAQGNDSGFAFYLFEGRKYDDLLLLLEQSPKGEISDSVGYILGMTHYYRKEFDKSAGYLSAVSCSSAFYDKSIFFSSIGYAHLGEYSKAQTILENYSATAPTVEYDELLNMELAGLALLKRDFEMFDHHSEKLGFERYHYADSETQLMNVRKTLCSYRRKSALVAGLLSAAAPGTGKIYTGHIGEGVAAFLTVGSLAAITAENWMKNGPADLKTITFGAICSIFYIGNIYGSAVTVQIRKNQIEDKQNHTVLLAIHLPVRALFE